MFVVWISVSGYTDILMYLIHWQTVGKCGKKSQGRSCEPEQGQTKRGFLSCSKEDNRQKGIERKGLYSF
jgi:hypothetical protein